MKQQCMFSADTFIHLQILRKEVKKRCIKLKRELKKLGRRGGASLAVQWLRLCTLTAKGPV